MCYIPESEDNEVTGDVLSIGRSVSGTDGKLGRTVSVWFFLIPFKDSALSNAWRTRFVIFSFSLLVAF